MSAPGRPTLATVMAASHSGSTLLAILAGAHRDATTIGDMEGSAHRKDLNYLCSCGVRARACSFWADVGAQMIRRVGTFDLADFGTAFRLPCSKVIDRALRMEHRGPAAELCRDVLLGCSRAWSARFAEVSLRNLALVQSVGALTGARVLVDSSKQPHRVKFLLRISELDVRVIHLIRDGRGVVHTYLNDNQWSVDYAARQWRRAILAERHLLNTISPDRWIDVRYEDVCADPKTELARIATFLGLEPEGVRLDFRGLNLHVFGNKMRMQATSEIKLDDRWRTELTANDLAVFERIAGPLNRSYGHV